MKICWCIYVLEKSLKIHDNCKAVDGFLLFELGVLITGVLGTFSCLLKNIYLFKTITLSTICYSNMVLKP